MSAGEFEHITEEDIEHLREVLESPGNEFGDETGEVQSEPETSSPGHHMITPRICEMIQESDKNIGELSRELGWSKQAINRHRRDECVHRYATPVGSRRCGLIRILRREDGESFESIGERMDIDPTVARNHARGDCECDTDIEPVGSTYHVSLDECLEMCRLRESGRSMSSIGRAVGRPKGTVGRHVNGECSHSHQWHSSVRDGSHRQPQ